MFSSKTECEKKSGKSLPEIRLSYTTFDYNSCHCHNDFGLAVANTLAGIEAGARYFHVCVNGIGERAGMPDMAQTVIALNQFYGIDLGICTEKLTNLSQLVARACHQSIAPWQPIVGHNVFAHESGIHAKGVLEDSKTFEPFPPELVGGKRRLVVGKHSGRAVIHHALTKLGIDVDKTILDECLQEVRALSIHQQSEVSPEALASLYANLVAKERVSD